MLYRLIKNDFLFKFNEIVFLKAFFVLFLWLARTKNPVFIKYLK